MPDPKVRLREADESDMALLYRWACDPDVRAASFHNESFSWDQHVVWFRGVLSDPGSTILIIETAEGLPVGTIRFQPRERESVIVSLTIGKEHRGHGYGTAALRAAAGRVAPGTRTIVALILPGNDRSTRTFRNAGFLPSGRTTVNGQEAVVMVYETGAVPDPSSPARRHWHDR